jgi:F-box interacting protein
LTGRYKIVHVPCYHGRLEVVDVFTLGEKSWRSVPLPAAIRAIGTLGSGGVVSVDGTTYWIAEGGGDGKAVSFDLGDERIYATPLPVAAQPGVALAVVCGRLGVAFHRNNKTDVWVLERGRWRHRYDVRLGGSPQRLTMPHFAHGKGVLTRNLSDLYLHKLGARRRSFNVRWSKEPAVCDIGGGGFIYRTFAYVETREPLTVYEPAASVTTGSSV